MERTDMGKAEGGSDDNICDLESEKDLNATITSNNERDNERMEYDDVMARETTPLSTGASPFF